MVQECFIPRRMWLSTGQAAPVLIPAHDSSIHIFNLWQIKKTAGSKWTDFQHWQQSISSEAREAPGREEQQFAGTRLHQGLQQLMSPSPAPTPRAGRLSLHPSSAPLTLQNRIPAQGQTHTAHWLRFSMFNSALLLALPLEKLPSAAKYIFLSKCDFCFQNPGRKLETIH